MKRIFAVMLACAVAGGCSGKHDPTVGGGGGGNTIGTGTGTGAKAPPTACDGIRAKVEQLYRAEAQAKEPKRVDEAVADNTAMVMNDCAKAAAKVTACVNAASTVAEIEKKCLIPLDEEGTEGEELRK
jgi:hypothetical protein